MKTTYTVERIWPHNGKNNWRVLPEHKNVTLKRARELVADGKEYEGEGMRQRIIMTTHRTLLYSRSRLYSAERMAARRNIRGY